MMSHDDAFQALPPKPSTFEYIPTDEALGVALGATLTMEFICGLEWALSRSNTRVDGYYFGHTDTHWHLFSLEPNPETNHWKPYPLGASLRGNETAETACIWLLLSHLTYLGSTSNLGSFEFIQDTEFLSEETIWLIAEHVWG